MSEVSKPSITVGSDGEIVTFVCDFDDSALNAHRLTMTPEYARYVAKLLVESADFADNKTTLLEVPWERKCKS